MSHNPQKRRWIRKSLPSSGRPGQATIVAVAERLRYGFCAVLDTFGFLAGEFKCTDGQIRYTQLEVDHFTNYAGSISVAFWRAEEDEYERFGISEAGRAGATRAR